MTDSITHQPLRVFSEGEARPSLVVPAEQLDEVTALLDANRVFYWVDEEVLSLDGKPEVGFINFGHGADPAMIQRLLDSIP